LIVLSLILKPFFRGIKNSLLSKFDPIKFDELIECLPGVSTHNFLIEKYGVKAAELLKNIINDEC
jgi:hypothetical protein